MKSFIKSYFDNKDLEGLKKTITPNWNSTEGHLKYLNLEKGDKVLELGCGLCRLLKPLIENKIYDYAIGIDASEGMINEAKKLNLKNITPLLCDGEGLIPLGEEYNNSFDTVFSIITFQHIPSTDTVKTYLKEAYRLLKEGGNIVFQVLSNDEGKGDLWTYHDLDELLSFLESLNLKVRREIGDRWTIFSCIK